MKNTFVITIGFLLINLTGQAQNKNQLNDIQQEVLDVVITLFDGMREADSAKVHSVFRQNVTLHTSFTRNGKPVFLDDKLQNFLDAVGTPHEEVWDEIIWDNTVQIDGNLATVWSYYAFYLDDKFSHCGVDAFMLNKDEIGWKIFHLTDTRKKQGCEIPTSLKK